MIFKIDFFQLTSHNSTWQKVLYQRCVFFYDWLPNEQNHGFSTNSWVETTVLNTLENQNWNQFENPKINSSNIDSKATVEMLNRKPRLSTTWHKVIYWPDGWPYYSIALAGPWYLCDYILLLYLQYLPFQAIAKNQNFVKIHFLH